MNDLPADTVKVQVWRLGRDEKGEDVVILRDETGRALPIWIAPCEATAIWLRLERDQARSLVRRPMTHDLFLSMIERLGLKIERIVIDDLANRTYYATLRLRQNGASLDIDARPSDAIALGLRADAPIFVSEAVMSEAAEIIEEETEETSGDQETPESEPD